MIIISFSTYIPNEEVEEVDMILNYASATDKHQEAPYPVKSGLGCFKIVKSKKLHKKSNVILPLEIL